MAKKGSKREIFVVMKSCCILPVPQIYTGEQRDKYMYISNQYQFPDCVYIRSSQSLQLPVISDVPQKAKIIVMIHACCDM